MTTTVKKTVITGPEIRYDTFMYHEITRIHYGVSGHGRKQVLFIHGFGASMVTWYEILPSFDPGQYTCYLIDLKGFGESSKEKDDDYSIQTQKQIVSDFISAKGLSGFSLIGHSFGGSISLLTAMSFPEKISRLILIDPAAFKENVHSIRFLRMPVVNRIIMSCFTSRFQARFTLRSIFFDRKKITAQLVDRYKSVYDAKGISYSFIRAAKQSLPEDYSDYVSEYPRMIIPSLIIWGREDRIIPLHYGKKLHSLLHHSKLVIIRYSGHNPHEEQPQETFRHIRMFLE